MTTTTQQAMLRGLQKGLRISAGDLSSIRKMRREIEETDYLAETWTEVGQSIQYAMNATTGTTTPQHRPEKSR